MVNFFSHFLTCSNSSSIYDVVGESNSYMSYCVTLRLHQRYELISLGYTNQPFTERSQLNSRNLAGLFLHHAVQDNMTSIHSLHY